MTPHVVRESCQNLIVKKSFSITIYVYYSFEVYHQSIYYVVFLDSLLNLFLMKLNFL